MDNNFNEKLEGIRQEDEEIYHYIKKEVSRQENTLELIPSENITSKAVMEAQGSVLTNKYSEGYPGKRYYAGNEYVDEIESIAIERAKKLFNAQHANVQPLSGAIMNIASFFAILKPGETILGMDLGHGGHLTHGHPVTHMYKVFNFVRYKTNLETGDIDYQQLREMALKYKPKLILAGFSAYPKTLDWKQFKEIADEVGAYTMADVSHIGGLIAGGVLENPIDYGFDIVTTTTHKTLRGPRGGLIVCREYLKNAIDKAVFPGLQGGPLQHTIAAKAICFKEALTPQYREYQQQVVDNAKAMEKGLKSKNITIIFGSTENHLILIDLRPHNLGGAKVETVLDQCGLCCNKNAIPEDNSSPMNPSGLRVGTPVITTRGIKEEEAFKIGEMIGDIINNIDDEEIQKSVKNKVTQLCGEFPLYN